MTASEASELLKSIVPPLDIEIFCKTAKHYEAIDMAIKSFEAWEKVKAEVTEIRDIEAKNHDTFDDYSDGRYDVACESLRIIDKHLKEVEE